MKIAPEFTKTLQLCRCTSQKVWYTIRGFWHRLELVLDNGESVIASRQYAPAIKQKIGL